MSDSSSRPIACPYCRAASKENFQFIDRRMTICSACRSWFTWPQPTPDSIEAHYALREAGIPATLREWRTDTRQSGWYDWLAARVATLASQSGTTVNSIADIGAGALELTRSFSTRFPEADICARDLFADERHLRAADVVGPRVSLEQVDLNRLQARTVSHETFDIVSCVAVIEHVIDPLALLHYLREITAPGGFAFVVGPRADSWARRLMGRRWPYYSPDDHVTLPTFDALRKAVAITGGGTYELRSTTVRYSSRYLLRFLHAPEMLAQSFDVLIPIPSGAFELVRYKNAENRVAPMARA